MYNAAGSSADGVEARAGVLGGVRGMGRGRWSSKCICLLRMKATRPKTVRKVKQQAAIVTPARDSREVQCESHAAIAIHNDNCKHRRCSTKASCCLQCLKHLIRHWGLPTIVPTAAIDMADDPLQASPNPVELCFNTVLAGSDGSAPHSWILPVTSNKVSLGAPAHVAGISPVSQFSLNVNSCNDFILLQLLGSVPDNRFFSRWITASLGDCDHASGRLLLIWLCCSSLAKRQHASSSCSKYGCKLLAMFALH